MVVDDRRCAGIGESLGDGGSETARTAMTRAMRFNKCFEDFASGSVARAVTSMHDTRSGWASSISL
jgi:hypothetical protein